MDVAPAAVEVAVVTGAVVQGSCMQQYAAAAAWVRQQAACIGGAAGGGRRGHDRNGLQAASVHAAAGGGCGVCAIACSGAACLRQHAAAAACVWQRVGAASSTIAMEDSDGSQRRWRCKEQRLTATSCYCVEFSHRHCAQGNSWKFAKDILYSFQTYSSYYLTKKLI